MSAADIWPWLAEALIASTLLIALVLLLRPTITAWFGVRAAYALWALPVLRFLIPPLPEGTAPVTLLPQGTAMPTVMQMREAVVTPAMQMPWVEMVLALWIGGAMLFVLIHGIGYMRFRRMMLNDGTVIGQQDGITLLESVHATGPLAFGILHKHVVVPIDFADRYSPAERALALAHEYMHHRRGDLAANMVAAILLALHWCNPVAWFAYRAFRADQELACDAQVLARHGQHQAQDYGRAILKAATATPLSRGNRYSICHLNTVDTLKGRLKMLSTHSASLHRISWGMSAVAIVTIAGLALTASGSQAAQEMATVSRHFSDAKLTRLASLLPQAPDVPESPEPPMYPEAMAIAETPPAPAAIEATEPAEWAQVPSPPTPPAVPATTRRVKITTHDGKTFYTDIAAPSEAEIAAMVPDVRVDHRCNGNAMVSTQNYADGAGKQHMRVSVCQKAVQRKAMIETQAAMVEARAEARAAMAEARAESERVRAEAAAQDKAARALAWAEDRAARAAAEAETKAVRAQAWAENEKARAEIRREVARQRAQSY